VEACVSGAYWAADQNCIGSQRILVQTDCYERFRDAFVAGTMRLTAGDPGSEETDVGPMISQAAAARAEAVVAQAIADGARLLRGHRRKGSLYCPTVLEAVPHVSRLWRRKSLRRR
jgi:acyl-CoA reductase-like NAD-dependent aldehyde dehydrogenase